VRFYFSSASPTFFLYSGSLSLLARHACIPLSQSASRGSVSIWFRSNVRSSRGQISAHPIRQRNGTDRNRLAVGAAISAYDQPLRRSRSASASATSLGTPLRAIPNLLRDERRGRPPQTGELPTNWSVQDPGGMNRIATLSESEREAGVGHRERGQSRAGRRARAADRAGVDATVVMPRFAPVSKVKATPRVRRQRPAGGRRRLRRGAGVRPRA